MARASGLQTSLVIHAVVYAVVIGGLVMMNLDANGGVTWSRYVAWGWGIGLAAHAAVWALYGRRPSR